MDTERPQIDGGKTEKLTLEEEKLLSEIEEITRLRTGDTDEVHGKEHQEMVAWITKYLAGKENANVFEATMSAWLHDWGRKGEAERQKCGDKEPHAEVSRVKSQRLILRPLLEEGKITEKSYQRILAIIQSHSGFAKEKMLEKKIVRDADRLSRLSAVGLHQVVVGAKENLGLPFYAEGQLIIRPRSVLRLQDLKCVVDNINLVIGFCRLFETKAAGQLADKFRLTEIYEEFLRTFAKYKDVVGQEIWEKWIASVAEEKRIRLGEMKQECNAKKREIELENVLILETTDSFGEKNFKKFLETEGIDIEKL